MQQRFLILQLGHLAEELPLQVPEPALQHLPQVAGQRCVRHVGSELVLQGKTRGEIVIPETETGKCRHAPGSKQGSKITELSSKYRRGIAF